jgi:hypothetical protein
MENEPNKTGSELISFLRTKKWTKKIINDNYGSAVAAFEKLPKEAQQWVKEITQERIRNTPKNRTKTDWRGCHGHEDYYEGPNTHIQTYKRSTCHKTLST